MLDLDIAVPGPTVYNRTETVYGDAANLESRRRAILYFNRRGKIYWIWDEIATAHEIDTCRYSTPSLYIT